MKNILLVSHCDFPSNSAVHVHHFANELITLGLDCVVAVPHTKETIAHMQNPLYKVTQFKAVENQIENLISLFENQQPPDIVHAWTPRERVRCFCAVLEESFRFKLIIHLEDNETVLLERFADKSITELIHQDELVHADLSHPRKYYEFIDSANGVTVIMDRLQEFVPEQIPTRTIWPGVDPTVFFPRSPNPSLVNQLGIPTGNTILCYTGNIHLANATEVKSLYRAVGRRNLENKSTILIRTGTKPDNFLSADEAWIQQYVIELGFIDREEIPEILALADILIQPGTSDLFNDYRFPSKIPEFLAMGKPIIVPESNIGRFLTHNQNAIVLPVVNEITISEAIDIILLDTTLAQTLSEGATQFAKTYLNWAEKGLQLKEFYQQVIELEHSERSLKNAYHRMRNWANDLRKELNQTQAQLNQTQAQLNQTQAQLNQTQAQLNQIYAELEQTKLHLQSSRNLVAAMESSKFWKLRTAWLQFKAIFRQ